MLCLPQIMTPQGMHAEQFDTVALLAAAGKHANSAVVLPGISLHMERALTVICLCGAAHASGCVAGSLPPPLVQSPRCARKVPRSRRPSTAQKGKEERMSDREKYLADLAAGAEVSAGTGTSGR